MVPIRLQKRLASLANAEVARRLIVQYFTDKGVEDFDTPMNPRFIADIQHRIPELSSNLEVVPYIHKLDPLSGDSTIAWNLFVIGTFRMYLGKTKHNRLNELLELSSANVAIDGDAVEKIVTPNKVVTFLTNTFKQHEDGLVEVGKQPINPNFLARPVLSSPTSSYYEKRRWGR